VTVYLGLEQILALHKLQIARYGGSAGLRDRGGVEAAIARPRMTFGGEDLYEEHAAKAAAIMHSLVMNHPFVDGNKRVGAHAALLYLSANDLDLLFTPGELTELTLATARGEMSAEAIAIWFRQRTRNRGR
jgi:death on curing protein